MSSFYLCKSSDPLVCCWEFRVLHAAKPLLSEIMSAWYTTSSWSLFCSFASLRHCMALPSKVGIHQDQKSNWPQRGGRTNICPVDCLIIFCDNSGRRTSLRKLHFQLRRKSDVYPLFAAARSFNSGRRQAGSQWRQGVFLVQACLLSVRLFLLLSSSSCVCHRATGSVF